MSEVKFVWPDLKVDPARSIRVSVNEDNSLPFPGRAIAIWCGEDITKSGDGVERDLFDFLGRAFETSA